MHRTQILLEVEQYERMKTIAERDGRSLASVIRDAIDAFLAQPRPDGESRLDRITAVADDPGSRGRDHDETLYGPRRAR